MSTTVPDAITRLLTQIVMNLLSSSDNTTPENDSLTNYTYPTDYTGLIPNMDLNYTNNVILNDVYNGSTNYTIVDWCIEEFPLF